MNYRREIDGLRAIAVLPVLLFHAGFNIFGGGFIGVDIFFVISGYLITSILILKLSNKQPIYPDFYQRRSRRILPALYVVMVVTIIFQFVWGLPSAMELRDLVGSGLASILFSSNIFFWKSSGYFVASAETTPLLHTWSLAVEEQYYFIFPAILYLLYRYCSDFGAVRLLIGMLTLSFILAVWGGIYKPTPAFYLLPTRAWELLAGALAAFHLEKSKSKNPSITHNSQAASLCGVLLILASIITIDASDPYPGFFTIAPVFGTVLIILYCNTSTYLYRILAHPALVNIGLISYSLYLWHQPVLAWIRSRSYHPSYISPALAISALAVSLLLAWVTYIAIEKPVRSSKVGLKFFGLISVALIFGLLAVNLFYVRSDMANLAPLLAGEDLAKKNYLADKKDSSGYYFGTLESPQRKVLLLGNSHARMLIPELGIMFKELGILGFQPTSPVYSLLAGVDDDLAVKIDYEQQKIERFNRGLCDLIRKYDSVILSYRYTNAINGSSNYFYNAGAINQNMASRFYSRIRTIRSCAKTLVIVGPVPESPSWGPNLNRYIFGQKIKSTLAFFHSSNQSILNILKKFESINNVHIVYPEYHLCPSELCLDRAYDAGSKMVIPFYYDDTHLTSYGSKLIVKEIVKFL